MKKYIHVFALFLTTVFSTSCGQTQTTLPKENIKSETKDLVTFPGGPVKEKNKKNDYFDTEYEYTDAVGKRLVIQNSFPRGRLKYTDPNGRVYIYAIFWTRIINETANSVEYLIDFPVDSFELTCSPGNYFKIFLPADTMTPEKENVFNYGLPDLNSFLDKGLQKASSLNRTINPKGSSGFYFVTLFNRDVNGVLRTGLSLKGQNLFYRIHDKEIACGKIDFVHRD